jgi:uncharacterized Fe-S cluster-containing radical SAM superfamily enzyme
MDRRAFPSRRSALDTAAPLVPGVPVNTSFMPYKSKTKENDYMFANVEQATAEIEKYAAKELKLVADHRDAVAGIAATAAVEQIVRAKSGVALIEASSILEHHWLATKMLASELRERGVVRRDRAQDILDRWMPVRGGSMLEALGYQ